jgi:hypothetical protein
MRLATLLDNRDWVTLYSESDGDRITFDPWNAAPEHSLNLRIISLPTVWATLPIETFPVCAECGEPFGEQGRFEATVCFQPTCTSKHDPDPPPKNQTRRDAEYVISEAEKKCAGHVFVKIHCFESESRSIS